MSSTLIFLPQGCKDTGLVDGCTGESELTGFVCLPGLMDLPPVRRELASLPTTTGIDSSLFPVLAVCFSAFVTEWLYLWL